MTAPRRPCGAAPPLQGSQPERKMTADHLLLPGGIGLFLLGMQVMTEALRTLGSSDMRRALARFTTSPVAGTLAGAAVTAAIQSSSATMVTTIGLVGAGLLTFPQAVGIVFGANIGTTVTGWMVALLGLKVKLGTAVLPLLLLASLLRILGRGRLARIGTVLAGFSLVFLGLDMMQAGARTYEGLVTPDTLPEDSLAGRLRLVLTGMAITVVIQSSSAGIAMVLVLHGSGAVSLAQALALVIGMDIGTTATALLASLGGSRDMRRTAVAHLAFNLFTATLAFSLLGLVAPLLAALYGPAEPAAIVTFHTAFNVTGALLMLPLAGSFAAAIARLVPGRGEVATDRLSPGLLADAGAALDAAQGVADDLARRLFAALGRALSGTGEPPDLDATVARLRPALDELSTWLARIRVPEGQEAILARYSAQLHMGDHLRRLAARMEEDGRLAAATADPGLRRPARALAAALARAAGRGPAAEAPRLARLARLIEGRTERLRRSALLRQHAGLVSPEALFELTDAMRWLARTAAHTARIGHHAVRSGAGAAR